MPLLRVYPAVVLLLASSSPRRRDLLLAAGIPFVVCAPGPEPVGDAGMTPKELARMRASSKAKAPAVLLPETSLDSAHHVEAARRQRCLGVDTVIDLMGEEIGKPADAAAARESLARLAAAGRHQVHTAHALRVGRHEWVAVTTSEVEVDPLTIEQIEHHVADENLWRGKAGGYGIQDRDAEHGVSAGSLRLVAGDLDTVIGLSVACVRDLLRLAADGHDDDEAGPGERQDPRSEVPR